MLRTIRTPWLALALALTLTAMATAARGETTASSGATAGAVVAPTNIGNPVINLPSTLAAERLRQDIHTNQAATAGTVFVNPPAADTCAMPGSGGSLQLPGGGAAVSIAGEASANCETRADSIHLKVTGAPAEVIKARQCMSEAMRNAYAMAGMPCEDKRPLPPAPPGPSSNSGRYSSDPLIAARQRAAEGGR